MTWTNIWAGEAYKIDNPDGKLTEQFDTEAFCHNNTLELLH
jgi:hypothetical protein